MHRAIGVLAIFSVSLLGQMARPAPAGDLEQRVAALKLPAGFSAAVFATKLGTPRMMAVSPSGVLYVSNLRDGKILALPSQGGGKADKVVEVATGLMLPSGLAFHGKDLYVGETGRIVVLKNADPPPAAPIAAQEVVKVPERGMHYTRTLLFGRDGKLYVSIGSDCNICKSPEQRRATITRYNPDGSGEEIYARGLRNAVGIRLHPSRDEIWTTDNGRDYLGDELPPEEINVVSRAGMDFGWPYCYGTGQVDPQMGSAERCAKTEPVALGLQAHSAALGLEFYSGKLFPAPYKDGLYVAYHGSWNRSAPTGYKVVRVVVENNRPVKTEDFVTGFLQEDNQAWGRPVDVITGADGALYITDDRANAIYRVAYTAKKE